MQQQTDRRGRYVRPRRATQEVLRLDPDAHYMTNAYTLASLASLAYLPDPASQSVALRHSFPQVIPFDRENVEGFVAANREHVVLALRGTDELQDWVSNFRFKQILDYGGSAHEGFATALALVWEPINQAIDQLATSGQTLWITGHSLGGALATLAAWRLDRERERPYATYTFGAPRTLDPIAARRYNGRLYRFVNSDDVVPDVPFPGIPCLPWQIHYKHVGMVNYFSSQGHLLKSVASWTLWVRRLSRVITKRRCLLEAALAAHSMEQYQANIRRNL